MTHSPNTISLTATTGKQWSLTIIRPLSPCVQLVQQSNVYYALKSLTSLSDSLLQSLLADSDVWRAACEKDSTNIVRLFDVAIHNGILYYIMEYCPGGHIGPIRAERPALKCLSAIASALHVLLSSSNRPAHANLSSAHVYLDATNVPKIAGWGISRVKRLSNTKRRLSERDDVRAMVAMLYEMIYGMRFDVENKTLPNTPHISAPTAAIFNNILLSKNVPIPTLVGFRYDLAAARKILPGCTPALPSVDNPSARNLREDLDSKRGVQNAPSPAHLRPQRPPVILRTKQSIPVITPSPLVETSPARPPIMPMRPSVAPVVTTDVRVQHTKDQAVDQFIRKVTSGDLFASNPEALEPVLDALPAADDLPENIFKVMFRIPISKNPIVAYKAIAVLHRLLVEGPAKMTAMAITNDEFLNWIETSWSRERIQNKTGKVHMYTYCFVAGEISWYTALLRRRMQVHGRFAYLFSTHWLARTDGLPALKGNRREVFRLVLEIVEKSSTLVRKVVTAKDPAAAVKQSAIPVLVADLAKTYLAICWLYATAEKELQPELRPELEVAHAATKSTLDAVRSFPDFAASCPPSALLDLASQVPKEFDVNQLTAELRKKKKKKKARPTQSDEENDVEQFKDNEESEKEPIKALREKKKKKAQKLDDDQDDLEENLNSLKMTPKRNVVEKRERRQFNSVGNPARENMLEAPVSYGRAAPRNGIQTNGIHTNGLQKVSLSVRQGAFASHGPSYDRRNSLEQDRRYGLGSSSSSRSSSDHSQGYEQMRPSEDHNSDSSDAEEEEDDDDEHDKRRLESAEKIKSKKNADGRNESGSESESEEEASTVKEKKKKKKAKLYAKKRQTRLSAVGNEYRSPKQAAKRTVLKKAQSKKHVHEKAIPFDKEHPKGKGAAKKAAQEEEYTGGSKEALEAAARGQKTPRMNPKYEVAPYEVHFGPQVGSGGFGVVYKAKFRTETVAVKKIHSHALSNAGSVMEFQAEVAVLCTLSHPNILRFVGASTRAPNLMIITEFMSRGTLFDLLHQSDMRVTWPMRKKFALHTCKGMRYLHDSKLLHRDLKSSNLMLDKDFNCKVGDFGLTRISNGASAVQMTGQCGTFQYMAVEVLASKPYSEKADVFSFGILLWEMVARKLPYFGMQPMQVAIAVMQQGLRPTIPTNCPAPLAKLMRLCWDNNPDRRPSFAQLVTALGSMPE